MYFRLTTRTIIIRLIVILTVSALFGLLIGHMFLVVALSSLTMLIWHYHHLLLLVKWLWRSNSISPPQAEGVWGRIYDGLYRQTKQYRNKQKLLNDKIRQFRDGAEALPDAALVLSAEKMAILGNLSAEVSHEINTPIGISITSTSYLSDLLTKLTENINQHKLSKRNLDDFVVNAEQSLNLLLNNLQRASELISSYKQVAVDQTSDKIRHINLGKYIDEIIQSLHPKLKKTNHSIKISCSESIEIFCHAGAISQIFTNLIVNSIIHGFEGINRGVISINVEMLSDEIHIQYSDTGVGIARDKLDNLFDPFYTTKSDKGGTGLGTHIIYNLVTDTLNGTIEASCEPGQGLCYNIYFKDMQ